ncbi:MAG: ClpXP protease specificity-enhancing factor [Betaproteobacteria bacterium]
MPGSSTRPYLIRALHDWCTDNGFTPYLAVHVDRAVQVPMEYVKNNEIVLNVGFEATSGLKLGNDFIEFRARFGGMARDILVPVDHVVAIYARENGQGMAFPMPTAGEEGAPTTMGDNSGRVTHSTAPAADGAPRGLRLAQTPSAAPAVETADANDDGPADDDTDPPDTPTPPPSAPRPALKRIK